MIPESLNYPTLKRLFSITIVPCRMLIEKKTKRITYLIRFLVFPGSGRRYSSGSSFRETTQLSSSSTLPATRNHSRNFPCRLATPYLILLPSSMTSMERSSLSSCSTYSTRRDLASGWYIYCQNFKSFHHHRIKTK